MKPDISEFSFGYAITESLIRGNAFGLEAAPVFPSLIQEGQEGGGFDVHLPFEGSPLFLQFKLSDCMVGDNAKEANDIGVPYYRMHIRPLRHSLQHQMLLDLEADGRIVYYVAPKFHTSTELNEAYLGRQVAQRSIFIQPSLIGDLDNKDHYVVFKEDVEPIVCSEPKKINQPVDYRSFVEHTTTHAKRFGEQTANHDEMQNLQTILINIIEDVKPQKELWKSIQRQDLLGNRPLITQTAYIARTFFGCEMYVVRAV